MIETQHIIALVVVSAGAFFLFVGSLGILRFPDFYSRAHAAGKSDTLGIMLVLVGLVIYDGITINSAKLLIAIIFVGLSNPIGTHALAKAAFRYGLKPWFRKDSEERNSEKENP